jgi:CubicO group peptidase (beta-lactamase class C family)
LAAAFDEAAEYAPLHSLLVARNGVIVGEIYPGEQKRHHTLNVKSVTKSVTSMLIGIAARQKLLRDVYEPLSAILPEYFSASTDERKHTLTVWHLLTMSAGLGWVENAGSLRRWQHSEDWARFALDLPMVGTPGGQFNYNTTLSHLLSAVLTRLTGMTAFAYAERELFAPLGITGARWKADPQGLSVGGTDLWLTSRDMLKLGQLYLHEGKWGDRVIVDRSWVHDSLHAHIALRNKGFWHPAYHAYGYQWWLRTMRGHPAAVASGYGGQMIYVMPDLQLVVVTTAHADVAYQTVMQQSNHIEDMVENTVLPAIQQEQ